MSAKYTQPHLRPVQPALRTPAPDESVFAGLIEYVDFDTSSIPTGNFFYPFMHKRLSFAHERELRGLISRFPIVGEEGSQHIDFSLDGGPGVYVPADVEQLVEAIYVAPQTPPWLIDLITSILDRYALKRSITQSTLGAAPLY